MADETNTKKQRWWTKEHDKTRHHAVFSTYRALKQENEHRAADNLHHARMYGTRTIDGFSAATLARTTRTHSGSLLERKPRLAYNLVQSVVDTVHAKVAKNKVRTQYLTEGGSFEEQQQAKKVTKAADGLDYEADLATKEKIVARDSEVFGTGVLHVFERDSRVQVERVLPDEILIDEVEAIYGEPRQMFREKWVMRDVLTEWATTELEAPKATLDLLKQAGKMDGSSDGSDAADMVLVVEAWHLRSGPNADDGLHVICVDNVVLVDEDFEEHDFFGPGFPFEFVHYCRRLVGFWAQGVAERLTPIQYDLNKTFIKIENALDNAGVTRVLKRRTAQIPNEHIRNRNMKGIDIIDVDNPTDVTVVAPNVVSPELWQHAETQIRRGFEQEGVSMLDAASKKPAGIDSGKGLRDFNDITSDRHVPFAQELERAHVSLTKKMLALAKKIAERPAEKGSEKKAGYKVRMPGKRKVEVIDLADLKLHEDGGIMKPFPTSALPLTPGAKRQEVMEWMQGGLMGNPQSPETIAAARRLLDFPDLEADTNLETAEIEDIDDTITKMLEHGEFLTPEPWQNLMLGIKRMQRAYLRARIDGAPDDRLQLLRDWIDQAEDMLNGPAEAVAKSAPVPAPGMAPGMPPAPPPGAPAPAGPPMVPPMPIPGIQ